MLKKVIIAELKKEDIVSEEVALKASKEPKAEDKKASKEKEDKKESTNDGQVESKSIN